MSVTDVSVPIFRFFEEISAVPRGSGNEEGISRYLAGFAEMRGLRYVRDGLNNVVIYKPGSGGREDEAPLMLQAHMDMVCEKRSDLRHDFVRDPLRLRLEGDFLRAEGTTLGADDGVGVSWILAILDDPSLSHPPLECVFTVSEETGMGGAMGLKKEFITARRMIGLDGHGETSTCVTSSGGRRLTVRCPVAYAESTAPCWSLTVDGLRGGHSGGCIDQGLGNAILLGFRILYQLLERSVDVRIAGISGGAKMNAIPRQFAVLYASEYPAPRLERYLDDIAAELKSELSETEPGLTIRADRTERAAAALTREDSGALITMGYLLPDGVLARSPRLGIPTASLNVGVVTQTDGSVDFDCLLRSPNRSAREDMSRRLEAVSSIFGGFIQLVSDYDGWPYAESSPLREALRRVLRESGEELTEEASHGGLETGVFKGRYPDMDIITYGPRMSGCHTPDETLDLASFRRSYDHLVRLLSVV